MSANTPAPASLPSDPDNFDFDAWRRLAEQDPKAFFAQREQAIAACIAGNPSAAGREQMREMQAQIDGMRLISANPDRALQGIATLLSDHLQALGAHLAGLGEEARRLSGLTQQLRGRLA